MKSVWYVGQKSDLPTALKTSFQNELCNKGREPRTEQNQR